MGKLQHEDSNDFRSNMSTARYAYWAFIFTGSGDQLTFALNHIYHTSGRGPHVGGTSGYYQDVHIFNNYYDHIDGHAIEPDVGSKVLLEVRLLPSGSAFSSPALTICLHL